MNEPKDTQRTLYYFLCHFFSLSFCGSNYKKIKQPLKKFHLHIPVTNFALTL